jgi:hypothetical protein
MPRNGLHLQEVVSHIAGADYELGCAARQAELAGAMTLSVELTNRMRDLVKLREEVRKQIGGPDA